MKTLILLVLVALSTMAHGGDLKTAKHGSSIIKKLPGYDGYESIVLTELNADNESPGDLLARISREIKKTGGFSDTFKGILIASPDFFTRKVSVRMRDVSLTAVVQSFADMFKCRIIERDAFVVILTKNYYSEYSEYNDEAVETVSFSQKVKERLGLNGTITKTALREAVLPYGIKLGDDSKIAIQDSQNLLVIRGTAIEIGSLPTLFKLFEDGVRIEPIKHATEAKP